MAVSPFLDLCSFDFGKCVHVSINKYIISIITAPAHFDHPQLLSQANAQPTDNNGPTQKENCHSSPVLRKWPDSISPPADDLDSPIVVTDLSFRA